MAALLPPSLCFGHDRYVQMRLQNATGKTSVTRQGTNAWNETNAVTMQAMNGHCFLSLLFCSALLFPSHYCWCCC